MDLVAELDLDVLLHSIVARAVRLLRATSGGLHLYQAAQDLLEWTTVVGPDKPAPGVVLHRGEGLAGRIWETGQPIIVDDYHRWEGRSPAFDGFAWTAVVGVPVRWGEEFLGVLDVVSEPPRRFEARDAELLSLFASQAAIAIRNARMLATADAQRRRAEALARATASLTSTLEQERLLENILEAAIRAIPAAERGRILLTTDQAEDPPVRVGVGYAPSRPRRMRFRVRMNIWHRWCAWQPL
jgi:GAF domain-containing protein